MVAILDLLFAMAFIGFEATFIITGVRIVSLPNDRILVLSSTISFIVGLASSVVVWLWSFWDTRQKTDVAARYESWKRIIFRYPALIGPAAYYIGEYRPNAKEELKWFSFIMKTRRVLDRTAFLAWYGTLAVYALVVVALVAAFFQSSILFLSVCALFVAFVGLTGMAFCLLSVVVLVHVVTNEP